MSLLSVLLSEELLEVVVTNSLQRILFSILHHLLESAPRKFGHASLIRVLRPRLGLWL
jgi:hypothetical protein